MAARTLLVLIAFAGDPAPNLRWTRIVASDPTRPTPGIFSGYTTVLLFLGPVSINQQAVSRWNELVAQFAGKPVNFVWIANEKEATLLPFLKEHPVRAWMLLDPEEVSYRDYGVEGGDGVLVDPHGIISGFTGTAPQPEQIQAVLEGRAIAIEGEPTEEQLDAFFAGTGVRLEAQPSRMPLPPQKPDLPPSDEVHISLSKEHGTVSSSAPDHWMRRGFSLQAMLSSFLNTSAERIELPPSLDRATRYDFIVVPPQPEDEATIRRRVREAIAKYFGVTVTQQFRTQDVYVITTEKGKTPPRRSAGEDSGAGVSVNSTWSFSGPYTFSPPEGAPRTRKEVEEVARRMRESPEFLEAIAAAQLAGTSAISTSMEDFRRGLEEGLHRPVVDETGLTGTYDFEVKGEAKTTEQFLAMLRDQLGLVVTPAVRDVEMVIVRQSQ